VTAVILIAAALIAIAGVLIIAATTTLRRLLARERAITGHAAGPGRTKLGQVLSGHELAEAMGRAAAGEDGDCGCWWLDIDDGRDVQVFPCGRHEAMLRAVREAEL
jgi:hypothetical protein